MRGGLALCFVITLLSACTRGYYDRAEVPYDLERATSLIKDFKNGTLVVQIPCAEKKLAILKSQHLNEEDPDKKEEKRIAYETEADALEKAQQSMYKGIAEYYTFSNTVFVPDTLIAAFKSEDYDRAIMDLPNQVASEVKIKEPILFLRDTRDFDDLAIYTKSNQHPPRPFPFTSSTSTSDLGILKAKDRTERLERNGIYIGITILNRKLHDFHRSTSY